ncbi:MAG: HRDC domain-containing protein [Planctomycetes bacterium]|nr:HRDC domain-containing protein [Planctomycetota bacterium]
MRVRVITLAYSEALGGFPEQALSEALSGQEVLELRDHFFLHAGRPHIALVLAVAQGAAGGPGRAQRTGQGEDAARLLPPDRVPVYRSLRQWRNDRARADGIPSYLIARNSQLAQICLRAPRTMEDLRAIDQIGEATCAKYGAELLAMVPPGLEPHPRPEPEQPAVPPPAESAPPEAGAQEAPS